jgi:hypothetical protein
VLPWVWLSALPWTAASVKLAKMRSPPTAQVSSGDIPV